MKMRTFPKTIFLAITFFSGISLTWAKAAYAENCADALPRFRLLKLLDVQLDSPTRPQNLTRAVEDGVLSELKRDLGGSDNVGQIVYPSVRSERSDEAKYCAQTLEFLKELKSDITEVKEKIMVDDATPRTQIFDDFETECYPIGVDKHRFCRKGYPSNIHQQLNGTFPKSCKELLNSGRNVSGVYLIHPKGFDKPLSVLCDMDTRGGGWIHIQKRFDGSEDFFRGWRDYKFGFGDLSGEFWFGLENTYKITASAPKELLIELTDTDGKDAYVQYKTFEIGSEVDGYALKALSGYKGDLRDSLAFAIGSKFSTKDFDRDEYADNCALKWTGAWWMKSCFESSLNGKYINTKLPSHLNYTGMHWFNAKGNEYINYAKSRMMIRTLED